MAEVIASPSVRALAGRLDIDLEALARRLGRTTLAREDVEGAHAGTVAWAPRKDPHAYWAVDHGQYGPVSEEPFPRLAQVAARNLAAANSLIPQVTHHDEAPVAAIEAFRDSLKAEAAARGLRLTALAFHLMALSRCLEAFPRFNASLSADGQILFLKHYVHIGIAVDTAHGLIVPVLRDAGGKGLWQISREIADFGARARARRVRPDELGGASMTISNLGGIGGTAFTPIINPPELAILGITRTRIAPHWDGETFRPTPMVPLDLSYDHRVINGADAARFLAHYGRLLSEPHRLLL